MTRIPLIKPDVRWGDVKDNIEEILESGMLTGGAHVAAFETEVAEICGVDHAVATTSATTALRLALAALNIGPGDEVVVADFTFPATANAILDAGAKPILADSGADDFAVDPDAVKAAITPKTKAIMPVDPFGQPADYDQLEKIAADAGIGVIADAACSLGAARGGRAAGSHGIMGCFSFHPRKMVTCGEGGMVTTDDASLATRLRLLRSHGMERDGIAMRFVEPAFNFRMSEIQAALGRSQLPRFGDTLADRRRVAALYGERLADLDAVTVPIPTDDAEWSYQSYVCVLADEIDRDAVVLAMRAVDVETTIGTYACHNHPAFRSLGHAPGDLVNSARFERQALTLPLVPSMSVDTVDRVVAELTAAVSSSTRL